MPDLMLRMGFCVFIRFHVILKYWILTKFEADYIGLTYHLPFQPWIQIGYEKTAKTINPIKIYSIKLTQNMPRKSYKMTL